eukprot:1071458-Rhodomonas_salina.4
MQSHARDLPEVQRPRHDVSAALWVEMGGADHLREDSLTHMERYLKVLSGSSVAGPPPGFAARSSS